MVNGNFESLRLARMLQTAQQAANVPLQTPGEERVNTSRFLSPFNTVPEAATTAAAPASVSATSSAAGAGAGASYYETGAILSWKDCAKATSLPSRPDTIDLEAAAQDNVGGTPQTRPIFADVSQGTTNMCTSMAFAHAYSLKYALSHSREEFGDEGRVPQLSGVYAYFFQRVEECAVFRVCPCAACASEPACLDQCNPPCVDCGSYLRSAATVFGKGVCDSAAWPYTSARDAPPTAAAQANARGFRVTALQCIPGSSPGSVYASLQRQDPVVVFLNLSATQVQWMQAQKLGTPPGTPLPIMPAFVVQSSSSAPAPVGHVVVIDGYDAVSRTFMARNSFGSRWGRAGRFAIAATSLNSAQVHSAVAVQAVCGPAPTTVFTDARPCP